jgi:hypothetical protein
MTVITAGTDQDRINGDTVTVTASATGTTAIQSMTGSFTALPSGAATPVLSGFATGLGTTTAALTQTFVLSAPGKYTWTAQATSDGLTSSDATDIFVTPQVGQPVPIISVVNMGYINVGGAPTLQVAITDNNDITVAESPFSPTGSAHVQIHAGPYQMGTFRISVRGNLEGTGAITRYVRLYRSTDLTTPVYTAIYSLTSSAQSTIVTPDSNAFTALTLQDRRELVWDVSDVSSDNVPGSGTLIVGTGRISEGVVG